MCKILINKELNKQVENSSEMLRNRNQSMLPKLLSITKLHLNKKSEAIANFA